LFVNALVEPYVYLIMKRFSFVALSLLLFVACSQNETPVGLPEIHNEADQSSRIEHTVLIEPNVSVGCGACPLGHHEIDQIEDSLENVTHMSHYLYGPLYHDYSSYLMEKINKTIYTPIGHVNRRHEDGSVVYYPINSFRGLVGNEIGESTNIGLNVSSNQTDSDLELSIEVFSEEELTSPNLKLTVILVEKIVTGIGPGYDQRNYGNSDPGHPYYGQGNYIQGFEHTNVIRHVLSSYEGDDIDLSAMTSTWTGNIALTELAKSPSAYRVIAFVSESSDIVMPIINAVAFDIQ
jgi:hypothetical protein